METKMTQPVDVISVTTKSTLNTIFEDIGDLPDKLESDIQSQGVEMDGPMIFVYRGCNGEMDNEFELEISQPVKNPKTYKGQYQVNRLEPFKCVQTTYKGSLMDLGPKGYEPFIAEINQQGLTMTDQSREIYTRYDGPTAETNITELQIGIQ